MKSRDAFFVNIYEANCSACIELNKEWELVSTELKGKLKVGKLNITETHELEEDLKLTKYPSVRFYKTGTKKID